MLPPNAMSGMMPMMADGIYGMRPPFGIPVSLSKLFLLY